MIPEGADPQALALLERHLKREMERREARDPASYFPWHGHQKWMIYEAMEVAEKDPRIILVCGGNRGGKSATAKGIYSTFMRRTSPLAKQLQTVDRLTGDIRKKNARDQVTVWIVPPTLEKARADWENPSDGFSIKYWLGDLFVDHKKTPDNIFYSRPPGMTKEEADVAMSLGNYSVFDKTILKSHDQALLSFEASAVDLCIVDEEMDDEKKWNSILMRLGTSNGAVVMAYTPLMGLSWTFKRYWQPLIKMKGARKLGDRRWISDEYEGACVLIVQFGAGDNPLAKAYADEVRADRGMSDAEKASRLDGEYGFVEGALIPQLSGIDLITPDAMHRPYVVDALPGRMHKGKLVEGYIAEWFLVTDPNKSYGAVLAAVDGNGNLFFVADHLEESWPDRRHAAAFRKMERKYVQPGQTVRRMADPGSAGAQSIVNMADFGLFFENVKKTAGSVASSIKRLRSLAFMDPEHFHPITGEKGAPRMYFYRPGMLTKIKDRNTGRTDIVCRLADQISQARQTSNPNAPPDTPHKDIRSKLDLFDCARYIAEAIREYDDDEDHPRAKRPVDDYHLAPMDQEKEESYTGWTEDNFYLPEYGAL